VYLVPNSEILLVSLKLVIRTSSPVDNTLHSGYAMHIRHGDGLQQSLMLFSAKLSLFQ
jgi:hypothetical protein